MVDYDSSYGYASFVGAERLVIVIFGYFVFIVYKSKIFIGLLLLLSQLFILLQKPFFIEAIIKNGDGLPINKEL